MPLNDCGQRGNRDERSRCLNGLFPFALSNGAAKKIIAAYAAIFHHDVQLGAKFIEVYQLEGTALKRNLLPKAPTRRRSLRYYRQDRNRCRRSYWECSSHSSRYELAPISVLP